MHLPAHNRSLFAPALCGLVLLAGCVGQVPVEQAERSCLAATESTFGPRSNVAMGITAGPGGIRPHAGLRVSLSSDALQGRDRDEVYNRCVLRRSGQMPRQPLYQRLGVQ